MGTILGKELYRKHKHMFYTKYSTNVKLSMLSAARQVTIYIYIYIYIYTNNCIMISAFFGHLQGGIQQNKYIHG
jgi:hypothetical protein